MSIAERLRQLQKEKIEEKEKIENEEQRKRRIEVQMLEEQMRYCSKVIDKLEVAKEIADIEKSNTRPQPHQLIHHQSR